MAADGLTLAPDYVFEEEIEYKTLVSQFENGAEQRRQVWAAPRRRFKLVYKNRTTTEFGTMKTLFDTSAGSYGTFLWTNPNDSTQRTVRFEGDKLAPKLKAYGVMDFEVTLLEVK